MSTLPADLLPDRTKGTRYSMRPNTSVKAIQFLGYNGKAVCLLAGVTMPISGADYFDFLLLPGCLLVKDSDWVMKTSNGKLWVLSDDFFQQLYGAARKPRITDRQLRYAAAGMSLLGLLLMAARVLL